MFPMIVPKLMSRNRVFILLYIRNIDSLTSDQSIVLIDKSQLYIHKSYQYSDNDDNYSCNLVEAMGMLTP